MVNELLFFSKEFFPGFVLYSFQIDLPKFFEHLECYQGKVNGYNSNDYIGEDLANQIHEVYVWNPICEMQHKITSSHDEVFVENLYLVEHGRVHWAVVDDVAYGAHTYVNIGVDVCYDGVW